MTSDTAKTLMLKIFDYQDPSTGFRLKHTADQYLEHLDRFVGNAEILDDNKAVGSVIFSLHLDKNAFELTKGEMENDVMGQGVGSRYLPFVYEQLREAGVRYIFATDTTEIAANMYESAGWTEGLTDLDLGPGAYGLDLNNAE